MSAERKSRGPTRVQRSTPSAASEILNECRGSTVSITPRNRNAGS
jgi:hypothetical protein